MLDAAAPGLKAVDVYESRPSAVDVLQSLTAPLSNGATKPDVISASLGSCEPATLGTIGYSGLRTVEGSLALAAASGISVLASSGDDGSSACLDPGGRPLPGLAVSYPASSPWVTGVGGTNVSLNAANQIISQEVWNDAPLVVAAGGGGLSDLFRRPGYQNGTVGPNRRAVPDVSMLADVAPGYEIYCTAARDCVTSRRGNPWTQVGGTSAAAPLLAGGLALIDQDLRLHRQQNIGLANPLLYKTDHLPQGPTALSDIVANNNDLGQSITGKPFGCCTAGPGYDYASGLGSVNVGGLAAIAADARAASSSRSALAARPASSGGQPPPAGPGLLLRAVPARRLRPDPAGALAPPDHRSSPTAYLLRSPGAQDGHDRSSPPARCASLRAALGPPRAGHRHRLRHVLDPTDDRRRPGRAGFSRSGLPASWTALTPAPRGRAGRCGRAGVVPSKPRTVQMPARSRPRRGREGSLAAIAAAFRVPPACAVPNPCDNLSPSDLDLSLSNHGTAHMQPDRFTIKSQEALQAAQRLADERRNPQTVPEHLLAVLLEQEGGVVAPVLRKLGVEPAAVRQALGPAPRRAAQADRRGRTGSAAEPAGGSSELVQILRAAENEMRELRDEYVSTEHLLLALARAPRRRRRRAALQRRQP